MDRLIAVVETARKNIPSALPSPHPIYDAAAATAATATVAIHQPGKACLGLPQLTSSTAVVERAKGCLVHRGADGCGSIPKTAGSPTAAAARSLARSAHDFPKTYVAAGNPRGASSRTSPPAAPTGRIPEISKMRSAHIGVDGQRLVPVPEGLPAAGASRASPTRLGETSKTVSTT